MSAALLHKLAVRSTVDEKGCLIWCGPLYESGYGQIHDASAKKPRRAHRVVYELCVGDIPDGFEVHHLCGVKSCINPFHLEAVDAKEHPGTVSTRNRKKTHCPQGRPYDEQNTIYREHPRGRLCRACQDAHNETKRRTYADVIRSAEREIEKPYRASVRP